MSGKFTDMMEIAIFLAFVGVCLFCAFTSLGHTTSDVMALADSQVDTRHLIPRNSYDLDYAYLGRPGAYFNVGRLVMSVASVSADRRAELRIFDMVIEPYDMFSLNVVSMEELTPVVYDKLKEWWAGFSSSPEYTCSYGSNCPARVSGSTCPDESDKRYVYSDASKNNRTFNPYHIRDTMNGYLFENPTNLNECKFKLQVVEIGIDCDGDGSVDCESSACGHGNCKVGYCGDVCTGTAVLEYHVFVFLGSLASVRLSEEPTVEYRWYDCVIGRNTGTKLPWVQTN